MTHEWYGSLSGRRYGYGPGTREEVLEEMRDDLRTDDGGYDQCMVWIGKRKDYDVAKFAEDLANDLIERVGDLIYDEVGGFGKGGVKMTKEEEFCAKFGTLLREHLHLGCFKIVDAEEVDLCESEDKQEVEQS